MKIYQVHSLLESVLYRQNLKCLICHLLVRKNGLNKIPINKLLFIIGYTGISVPIIEFNTIRCGDFDSCYVGDAVMRVHLGALLYTVDRPIV